MDKLSVYKTRWKVFKIEGINKKILCNDYYFYFRPTEDYSVDEVERKIREIHEKGELRRRVEREAREKYHYPVKARVERRSLIKGGFTKREEIPPEQIEMSLWLKNRIIDL